MLIKLILCPIDFSESLVKAYRHALSLAEHYRAKLVAQHIVELSRHPSLSFALNGHLYVEFCQALSENGNEQLQKFVKSHTHDDIQPELVVQTGRAPDLILSLAQSQKADVIVMGTHGRRGFDHLMLGSVTERVMCSATCPVLAVSGPSRDSEAAGEEWGHVHHLSRILFCTDFSENSEQALTYALSVRAEYDAELTLLHVLEEAPSPATTEKAIAAATERLAKMIQSDASNTLKSERRYASGKHTGKLSTSLRKRKATWWLWECAAAVRWILRCLVRQPTG